MSYALASFHSSAEIKRCGGGEKRAALRLFKTVVWSPKQTE